MDQSEDLNKIEIYLSVLGLTQYESKVFQTLIQYGQLDAKNLSLKSKVPQPKIYATTDSLEKIGLIDVIIVKKKKSISD